METISKNHNCSCYPGFDSMYNDSCLFFDHMLQRSRISVFVACTAIALAGCTRTPGNETVRMEDVPSGDVVVDVYFGNEQLNPGAADCSLVFPVPRSPETTDNIPLAALRALFAGPTPAEEAIGYGSFFSGETADMVNSVRVLDDTAYADLKDIRTVIPNASTSCGSAALIASIETTLKQFSGVSRVIIAIEGDPQTFYDWVQIGCNADNDFCDTTPFTPDR